MLSNQRHQFLISLAVNGRRFQLCEPGAVLDLLKRADPRVGFHFDLNDLHEVIGFTESLGGLTRILLNAFLKLGVGRWTLDVERWVSGLK